MASHVDFLFWLIFDWFLLPAWTSRTQFGASGLAFSWFFRFGGNTVLGSEFGANMATFSFSKSPQILPKLESKTHQMFGWFLHWFLHGFCLIFRRPKPSKSYKSVGIYIWFFGFRHFLTWPSFLMRFWFQFGFILHPKGDRNQDDLWFCHIVCLF